MAATGAPAHHHPLLFSPPQPVMQHPELAALQEHHHQEVMQPQPPQQQHCNYAMKTEMAPWPAMPYDHHAHHPLLQPLCNAGAAQSSASSAPPPQQQHQQLPAASAHLSATALLQKAAQMGATISGAGAGAAGAAGAHYTQMAGAATSAPGGATFGLSIPGLSAQPDGVMGGLARSASHGRSGEDGGGGGGGGGDGMTRDFLGLRAFSHRDILGLAGFDSSCMGAVNATMGRYEPQQHGQPQQQQPSSNDQWHGMGSHS